MRALRSSIVQMVRRFLRLESGVAAVEFALIMPIMLSLYLGCSEAAALLTADRKVQSVAGAIGDLTARANETIARAQLEDYFLAATSIMNPYDTADLVQTITAVSVSSIGEATVLWSVRYANGTFAGTVPEHQVGKPYNLPAEMIDIAKGQTVIAAEAEYSYRPLLGIVFKEQLDLHRSALFMPRFGGAINLS